jgi:ATP-dependent Clp protease adaptor protein ClpS
MMPTASVTGLRNARSVPEPYGESGKISAVLSALSQCEPMAGDSDKDLTRRSDEGRGVAIEEARPKLKRPPLFRVVLLNDDYTPMEFVVEVLELVFALDRPRATRVMLEVHTRGKGVCGVFVYEIAETKVAQVMAYAQQHQHPLLCTLEET